MPVEYSPWPAELGERTCLYVMVKEGQSLTLPERLEVLPRFPLSPVG